MWDKIKILEISRDAKDSLKKDDNGRMTNGSNYRILFYYLPLFVSVVLLFARVRINTEIANYFITAISIFAGLFFNLLLVIADKVNIRRQLINAESDEAQKNYVARYKHFSEQLISQISYTIIVSVAIIILMFLTHFSTWLPRNVSQTWLEIYSILKIILNGIIFFFGTRFLILLLLVLSSLYKLLLDDLTLKTPKK